MSILLAQTLPATLPTLAPDANSSMPVWLLLVCFAWAMVGLAVAGLLRAFRRQSVVGPHRLAADESAWDLLLVLFTAYFAGMVVFVGLYNLLHKPTGGLMLMLQGVVGLVIFFAGLVLLRLVRPDAIQLIGLSPRQISVGLVGGATTLFVIYPLIILTGAVVEWVDTLVHHKPEPHEILQFLGKTDDVRLMVIAVLLAVVVAPLNEELLFRGLLQTVLTRLMGWIALALKPAAVTVTDEIPAKPATPALATAGARWAAIILTALIFALYHGEPAVFAPIFVLAVGLGYVYERTGNLWMTITAHAMFNAAQIFLFMESRR